MTTTRAFTVERFWGRKLVARAVPSVVLIGFPCDEGVRRNNGRPGASLAPEAIREAMRSTVLPDDPSLIDLISRTRDAGNVPALGPMELDQERLGEVVGDWLLRGTIPIVLGGGHETAYGHFLGHVNAGQDVAILNWDAHADVKNLVNGAGHSGTPFRQAVLHPSRRCREYLVAGLLRERLEPSYLEFITGHGGTYVMRSELSAETTSETYRERRWPVMATFDMDAVDRSLAPGVSAPAKDGLTRELWLSAALEAGRHPRTLSMDLVEVNPKFDPDGRTVRLAAETVLSFMNGLAKRRTERMA